jgi:hypothetical protein
MQFLCVVGFEVAAMFDLFAGMISRPTTGKWNLRDELATASPQKCVSKGVQLKIHGPIA